jgi:hypothetical protein
MIERERDPIVHDARGVFNESCYAAVRRQRNRVSSSGLARRGSPAAIRLAQYQRTTGPACAKSPHLGHMIFFDLDISMAAC